MNDREHVRELSAAYALGALSADEAQAVEAHCAQCQECAADLAEMNGIAATLPLACAPASPSATLKRRILSAARGDAAADQLLRRPARQPLSPVWWAAAAAAFFVAGAALGALGFMDHRQMAAEVAQTNSELAFAQKRATRLQAQVNESQHMLTAIAAGHVWEMTGGLPRHWWHCTIVQPPMPGKAMLLAATPPAPKGMTYQAWVIHRGKTHNAGMLPAGTTSMMDMPMPVEAGDVVAFSVEPMGGSATPTMPFVMQQTLD